MPAGRRVHAWSGLLAGDALLYAPSAQRFHGHVFDHPAKWFGYGPCDALITPPPDAAPGPTRMRVRLTFTVLPVPCGWDSYGEVEDYTINVLPPPKR